MIRGLASTGLVNRFPAAAPHEAIIEWFPRLEVDGFELGIGRVWDHARVEHDLRSAGFQFATAHADKRIGAELLDNPQAAIAELEHNCRLAAALGATVVVLHLWELPVGDRQLEKNLALLPACLDIAEAAGVTLAVETIPCTVGSPLETCSVRSNKTNGAASHSTRNSSRATASSTRRSRTTSSGHG